MGIFSKHDRVQETASGINVESIRSEVPEFRRVYNARLDARASVKIEIRTSYGHRSANGELTQPNGRWILFDPDRIADKILDPTLVPLVERYVAEIIELDRQFVKSDPGEFIDVQGATWR